MANTEFGKKIRDLRLKKKLTQGDVARHLNKATSFYSALEVGRKSPPASILDELIQLYELSGAEKQHLLKIAAHSIDQVRINTAAANDDAKEVALRFARSFEGMDDETIFSLKEILDD